MERGLIEPSLYLRMDKEAPERFARALHDRVECQSQALTPLTPSRDDKREILHVVTTRIHLVCLWADCRQTDSFLSDGRKEVYPLIDCSRGKVLRSCHACFPYRASRTVDVSHSFVLAQHKCPSVLPR